jgi:hypothetical protein
MRLFCFLWLTVALIACGVSDQHEDEFSETRDYAQRFSGERAADDTAHSVPMETQIARFDSLLRFFEADSNEYLGSFYLHRNWKGHYVRNENALVALITPMGPVLLSCNQHEKELYPQDSLVIRIGQEKYTCRNGEGYPPAHQWGSCEATSFAGDDVYMVMKAIATHATEPITVCCYEGGFDSNLYALNPRDAEAISTATLLAENYIYTAVQ